MKSGGDLAMIFWSNLDFNILGSIGILIGVTVQTFKQEIAAALKAYEKYIVCLDKAPPDCEASLISLMEKAIKAYENRGANLRHGIALDRQVTIILSQTDGDRPLCGIYFNLHTPYQKKPTAKPAKSAG